MVKLMMSALLQVMKSNLMLLFMTGFLAVSMVGCLDLDQPEVEDITKGSKWNLQIGASGDQIYQKLVELGMEKEFSAVAIVGRGFFDDIDEVFPFLPYYNWLNYQSTAGRTDRVLIGLDSGRVSALYAGGAMLDSLGHWPVHMEEAEAVIRQGDTFEKLHSALENIQSHPNFRTYQYLLPDKPLDQPYDPDMRNFGQWYFSFQDHKEGGELLGTSQVSLFFEEDRLVRIHHVYSEY